MKVPIIAEILFALNINARKIAMSGAVYGIFGRIPNRIPKLKLLDIGIAICHFDLTTRELKQKGSWIINKPEVSNVKDTHHYIASWKKN